MNDNQQPEKPPAIPDPVTPPNAGDAMPEVRDIHERSSRSDQHRTGEKQAEENRQNESPA